MKKHLVKKLIEHLADAPRIAAKDFLKHVNNDDRADALRLVEALKIKPDRNDDKTE